MHNGGIPGFGRMKRQLMAMLGDEAYQAIEGTTDSEVRRPSRKKMGRNRRRRSRGRRQGTTTRRKKDGEEGEEEEDEEGRSL